MARRRRNPASRKTEFSFDLAEVKSREPCSPWAISAAWIDPEGKVFYPDTEYGETHTEWARDKMGVGTWELLQSGWIQVHSSSYFSVDNYKSLSLPAKKTMAQFVAYCVLARKMHHEKADVILYDVSDGNDMVYTPAQFVKVFGGRRMEDRLFGDLLRGVRVNPLASASGVTYLHEPLNTPFEDVLYALLLRKGGKTIGYLMYADMGYKEAFKVWALPGYGPMVLDLGAKILGEPLTPSDSMTAAGKRLWQRSEDASGLWPVLSDAQFKKKYGSIPRREKNPLFRRLAKRADNYFHRDAKWNRGR